MANRPKDPNVDLAALLESVHGKTDQQRRQDQLDDMLGQLEATHRPASAAIRHFEDRGRTTGEAAAAAAMAALVAAEARAAVRAVQDAKTVGRVQAVAAASDLPPVPTLPDVLSDEVTAAGGLSSANVGASEPTQVFALPTAAIVVALFVLPLLLVLQMSASSWPLFGGNQGINLPQNFVKAVSNPRFVPAVVFTIEYTHKSCHDP